MLQKYGPFVYADSKFEQELSTREQRELTGLKNGSVYLGEWLVNESIREG
jgi:hypothetical protein